jgi:hypothetical protein
VSRAAAHGLADSPVHIGDRLSGCHVVNSKLEAARATGSP